MLKWNKEIHTGKGKSVFLKQMEQFVDWLKNAEEGRSFVLLALDVNIAHWRIIVCNVVVVLKMWLFSIL